MEPTLTADAVVVRSLHKQRGAFAVRDLDLSIPTGYVTGLVGPNGAGKTTLVKAILGLIGVDAGEIILFGDHSPSEAPIRDRIGVVLDQVTAAPEWRVGSIGGRVGRLYLHWDESRFDELLDQFGVPRGNRVEDLSRGQTVKLSLAVALAHAPDLLVLDEPSTGLDPVARRLLADTLREFMLDDGHTVLFSTHITAELDDLADHVIVVDRGEVAYAGALDDLHERFAVARGVGEIPDAAQARIIGLRHDANRRWEGLIRVDDTAFFTPDVVIDQASTDDVVVHFAERGSRTRKGAAA